MNQKGFAQILILGILISLGLIVGVSYYIKSHSSAIRPDTPINQNSKTNSEKKLQNEEYKLVSTKPSIRGKISFIRNNSVFIIQQDKEAELIIQSDKITDNRFGGTVSPITWNSEGSKSFYYECSPSEAQGGCDYSFRVYDFQARKNYPLDTYFIPLKFSDDGNKILGSMRINQQKYYYPAYYDLTSLRVNIINTPWKLGVYKTDDQTGENVYHGNWDFSPNGSKIVYLTNNDQLYIYTVATNSTREIIKGNDINSFWGSVLWSPNGKFITVYKLIDNSQNNIEGAQDINNLELLAFSPEVNTVDGSLSFGKGWSGGNGAPKRTLWTKDGNIVSILNSLPFDLSNKRQFINKEEAKNIRYVECANSPFDDQNSLIVEEANGISNIYLLNTQNKEKSLLISNANAPCWIK